MIDIFIPVYRESKYLEGLLNFLTKNNRIGANIFVVADVPTKKTLNLKKIFEKNVNFIFNRKRLGKAISLNNAVKKYSKGDYLLFLDSDVIIKDKEFLNKIERYSRKFDFLDIKKKAIKNSFLSGIIEYEYFNMSFGNWILSKKIQSTVSVNGSAFAIRKSKFEELGMFKKVPCEDIELGIGIYKKRLKFGFVENTEIYTEVHSNLKSWFVQRKRWSIGAGLWFLKNLKNIMNFIKEYPLHSFMATPFAIPSLIIFFTFIISLFFKASFLEKFILFTLINFSMISFITWVYAKRLKYSFNIINFAFFFFVYSPVWTAIQAYGVWKAYKGDTRLTDWKF